MSESVRNMDGERHMLATALHDVRATMCAPFQTKRRQGRIALMRVVCQWCVPYSCVCVDQMKRTFVPTVLCLVSQQLKKSRHLIGLG